MPKPIRKCGRVGCDADATHVVIMKCWDPGIPIEARTDLNACEAAVGLQGCPAHGEEMVKDWLAMLQRPDTRAQIHAYYQDQGMKPPNDDGITAKLVAWEEIERMMTEAYGPAPGEQVH